MEQRVSVSVNGGLFAGLLLTSPPVTFFDSYLAICFLSSLLAAYLPTSCAMLDGLSVCRCYRCDRSLMSQRRMKEVRR